MESCPLDLVHVPRVCISVMPRIISQPGRGLITRSSASPPPSGEADSCDQHLPSATVSLPQAAAPQIGARQMKRSADRPPLQRERAFCFHSPTPTSPSMCQLSSQTLTHRGQCTSSPGHSILWQVFTTTHTWSETPEPPLHSN